MTAKIAKLTDKEHDWIGSQLEGASIFVPAFSPADAGQPLTLAALDRVFAAWLATQETDPQLINAAINCTGVAFGQFLVDGLGLNWVIATDEHGSDLAVHGFPGQGDVLVYPANFVAKRWERREASFLEESYRQMSAWVECVRQGNAAKGVARPWWKFW